MSKREVYDRDAGKCFYCGKDISFEESSHEHILAKTHGGSDNNYNTTVACKSCNLEAGQLPIVKKVALREEKLYGGKPTLQLPKKITTLSVGDIQIKIEED